MSCINYNLDCYQPSEIRDISYDTILNLPIRYPEFKIIRPITDQALFYNLGDGRKFRNYNKC